MSSDLLLWLGAEKQRMRGNHALEYAVRGVFPSLG